MCQGENDNPPAIDELATAAYPFGAGRVDMPRAKPPTQAEKTAAVTAALEAHVNGAPVADACRQHGVSRQALYKRLQSPKGNPPSSSGSPLDSSSGSINPVDAPSIPPAGSNPLGLADSPATDSDGPNIGGVVASLAPGFTLGALRRQVVQAVLDDDEAAQAAFARGALKQHRARSRQLWRKLQQLAAAPDLGAGARGSPASALAALAGAHARLVTADRLILGMETGQTVPAAADDTPAPVLGLVATATDDEWRRLAGKHRSGSTITAAEAPEQVRPGRRRA